MRSFWKRISWRANGTNNLDQLISAAPFLKSSDDYAASHQQTFPFAPPHSQDGDRVVQRLWYCLFWYGSSKSKVGTEARFSGCWRRDRVMDPIQCLTRQYPTERRSAGWMSLRDCPWRLTGRTCKLRQKVQLVSADRWVNWILAEEEDSWRQLGHSLFAVAPPTHPFGKYSSEYIAQYLCFAFLYRWWQKLGEFLFFFFAFSGWNTFVGVERRSSGARAVGGGRDWEGTGQKKTKNKHVNIEVKVCVSLCRSLCLVREEGELLVAHKPFLRPI